MIRVGLIGAGYIGNVHLEQLVRIGGVQVTKIVDNTIELAKKAATKYGIESYSSDWKDVVDDPTIDVIHNCTPNKYHFEINKRALLAGKQILSEKPLAMTLEEAQELWELSVKKNAVTGVDFCYRYYPVVQEAAARIRNGDLGIVRMVHGTWFQDWLSMETDYSWRLEKAENGDSNVMADLGSHWFDLIQYLTGQRITEVIGDFATLIPTRKKPKSQVLAFQHIEEVDSEEFRCELEEYAAVHFRLEGNIPGSFTTSQVCNGRKSETAFEIYGTNCSYAWNHKDATRLWIGHRFKANEELIENANLMYPEAAQYAVLPAGHPLGYHDAVKHLFEDFYSAIENGAGAEDTMQRPTFFTGYEEMRILAAVLKSVRNRSWETI
ncbi:Gfo/Idh/MocA family protein [Pleomorphochaeta sp. DL1XJH-081]|uniref:Gfo/Idh/MocA family protein n=1 Tax=Pleomorphochaeta sp. DL1XJH-081 TaxID=3409690 RepID=UPI003BB51D44